MADFGSLSKDQLLAAWRAGADPSYTDPLDAAGDGNGLEVYSSSAAQLERASLATDRTFQALYVLPWSGETNPPAPGDHLASVQLTLQRSLRLQAPLLLAAGTFVDELAPDWGETGTTYVLTGRRYALRDDVAFFPGDPGPLSVWADAEAPGWGYNNPQPGTISVVDQPGSTLANNLATVDVADGQWAPTVVGMQVEIVCSTQPDMIVPESEGQYLQFTAGANTGKVARITTFLPATPPLAGTGAQLDQLLAFESVGYLGGFDVGEPCTINTLSPGPVPTAAGHVVASDLSPFNGNLRTIVRLTFANGYAAGQQLTGTTSLYSARVNTIVYDPALVAEAPSGGSGGASWRILDWFEDLGLEVTNAASPTGGTLGVLDEYGREREVFRSNAAEDDDVYRQRVAKPVDRVSPNAIRRALFRALGPSAIFCLREVGQKSLPGFFYDGGGEPPSTTPGRAECDAYDVDTVSWSVGVLAGGFIDQEPVVYLNAAGDVLQYGWNGGFVHLSGANYAFTMIRRQTTQGQLVWNTGDVVAGLTSGHQWEPSSNPVFSPSYSARRFRMEMDYAQFRAFFMVGLPSTGAGEFGFSYDNHPFGAYDLGGSPYLDFYDGFPVGEATRNLAAFKALDGARALGVGFELYREDGSCP